MEHAGSQPSLAGSSLSSSTFSPRTQEFQYQQEANKPHGATVCIATPEESHYWKFTSTATVAPRKQASGKITPVLLVSISSSCPLPPSSTPSSCKISSHFTLHPLIPLYPSPTGLEGFHTRCITYQRTLVVDVLVAGISQGKRYAFSSMTPFLHFVHHFLHPLPQQLFPTTLNISRLHPRGPGGPDTSPPTVPSLFSPTLFYIRTCSLEVVDPVTSRI